MMTRTRSHRPRHDHADQTFRDQTTLIRLLEHLDHAIEDAGAATSADELFADRMRFNSVAMEMTQVQECARSLSDGYRETMPDLPWNELRALRNVLVHEYDEIDAESLYDTVTHDAPQLAARLRPAVDAIA
ncbi:HepT-like ribonuclease domain-containing protein [Bifidobacterium sp. SO1]|uniref:HepT-like ribonuclease domain-containing protein n=1 Tax=Bifidobacterium sp. SO1 TaxID=2809029 RepID=UPI001F0AE50C|nr:HepT-like ribonuclease domain-containing protein [Bifidobacterium sp. SO1]